MALKNIKWIVSFTMLLGICTIFSGCGNSLEFSGAKISGMKKADKSNKTSPLSSSKVIITDIHMGIGDETSVGMELACPYTSKKQYSQLWKYSNHIKNDFLLQVGSNQLKHWVKEKNYRAVKATFRNIVNRYVDEPVTNVFLSKFFVE